MITTAVLFNRKKKLDKNGKGTISIRLTLNRKTTYLSTKIKVYPTHWDGEKKRVRKSNVNWFEYNSHITDLLEKVERYNSKTIGENRSIIGLKTYLEGSHSNNPQLTVFIRNEIELRKKLGAGTLRHHTSKLKYLEDFLSRMGIEQLLLEEIDYTLLQKINNDLLARGLKTNTIWSYHKFIKSYLNIAIKKEFLEKNPYRNFKVEKEDSEREYLQLEEIKQFEIIDLKGFESHELVLDKFLFSCYTGLRISDLQNLKLSNFRKEEDKCYLTFRMIKTVRIVRDMPLHRLFHGKAIPIYEKYAALSDDDTLFPFQHEQKINEMLKDLAKLANVNKRVTFHVARHSFGSALARVYNDVLLIKELMGHAKIETSMIYIHMNPEIIEEKLSSRSFGE